MAGVVRITFKDAIGSEPIRADLLTSMSLFDLYEKVAQVTGRKIKTLIIQMLGSPYMGTELEKRREKEEELKEEKRIKNEEQIGENK